MQFEILFEITEDEVLEELEGLDQEKIEEIIFNYFTELLGRDGQGDIIQVDFLKQN